MVELYTEKTVPERKWNDMFQGLENPWDMDAPVTNIVNNTFTSSNLTGVYEYVTFCFYEQEIAAAAGKGIPATVIVDRNCTIERVYIQVATAPGGSDAITVDVNKNATTIFTAQGNRPSIVGTATTDESGSPSITNLVKNDKLTMDIDAHTGSAAQLTVYVRCRRNV